MHYLIDGYNLLHALGLARPRGPHQLERARADLLDWIRRSHLSGTDAITLVFDGKEIPGLTTDHRIDAGVRTLFSVGQSADDLIEDLLRQHHAPRQLTIVSNDRRIQEAARRRDCIVWSCGEYVESVLGLDRLPSRPIEAADKPESVTPEDAAHWQQRFADLDNDPKLREFNKPFEDFGRS